VARLLYLFESMKTALIFFMLFLCSFFRVEAQPDFSTYVIDSIKVNTVIDPVYCDGIAVEAHQYLGTPHLMGGLSLEGIDCSGLIVNSFKPTGLVLPHSANSQAFYGRMILAIDSLQKGDLLFFTGTYRSNNFITHVGIYLGEGQFIHTSSSKGVILSNLLLSSYWKPKFVFAKRIFL